ncbi:cytochrome P450 [Xylaria bambusicola]|uniref:cytochrome P450 n=1 Tax=Xylaria bambusicola TaxID=326684 RepID=UPI0020080ECB|nr:cytochrome P450 [Xylaria bambusicola]KAI0503202.1 cytochrome P450 [Xylaria bambusicola]
MLIHALVIVLITTIAVVAFRRLYPRPYLGIPYNVASANRISGDIPNLIPIIQETKEFSQSIFTVTTRNLRSPIAQLLFPGIRKPLIILEDPREIEDILVRRNKEFDKAPMAIDLLSPMFPKGSISQYTTPELRFQKRVWTDVMNTEFLQKAVAPNIYKATLELLALWRLKGTTIHKDQPFNVLEDLKNAALDAIWVAVVGDEPGITRYEIEKVKRQLSSNHGHKSDEILPRGAFIKAEVIYVTEAIARNSNTPVPKWAQKLETYTSRYRKFRSTVTDEITKAMKSAVDRFQRIETGGLDTTDIDTCMMDLVLRRQIVEAKKAARQPSNPVEDQNMLDEMFVMLVAGHDSTANALAWFIRFMEAYPSVQSQLRSTLVDAFPGPHPPSAKDILGTDIPYLDGVCDESMRLSGTTKANLRQALVDTEILGYKIPKGAEIFMNYHINSSGIPIHELKHSKSSQFASAKRGDGFEGRAGVDLHLFDPERWLVKDEDTGKEKYNAYALPQLAFGGGYRGCSGRKLATMEFRIIVVLLIMSLDFVELPEEFKTWRAIEKVFRQPETPYAKIRVI